MGQQKVFSYEDRFDLVLSYVYEHLDQPLDLIRLAEIAGISPRHWHRIFCAAFGESLPALVKRVRMQRAIALLADNAPIPEVAAQCGYPNISSFTRAFRTTVGITPADYRKYGTHVDLRIARIVDDPQRFPVRQVELAKIRCVAVQHRGSFLTIDRAFHDLRVWLLAHGIDMDDHELYGVYLSDPSSTEESELRSLACVTVPERFSPDLLPLSPDAPTPEWYSLRHGTYAAFNHEGAYSDMPESYAWLFGCWLPASGRVLTNDPVVEHYLSSPQEETPTTVRTDLLLPLSDEEPSG
ncbi:AraC family transcriptional regulator [Timonella sp. A28]|uniref:AraC family transcriptional regulator n=1 Tax=Timonella sp. A28 TaxID=3442640 RepID=UPI003EB6DDCF